MKKFLTKEQISFIIAHSADYTIKGIAEHLVIEHRQALNYINQKGLKFKSVRIQLTEKQKEYVRNYAGKMRLRDLSKEIYGSTKFCSKIIGFCKREGIDWTYRKPAKIMWLPEQIEQIRAAAEMFKKTG